MVIHMKKFFPAVSLIFLLTLSGCDNVTVTPYSMSSETAVCTESVSTPEETSSNAEAPSDTVEEAVSVPHSLLNSTENIGLHDTDGSGINYAFSYNGREFYALCETDNWHITDSFMITEPDDILIICRALSDVHPIHTADMQGYRTPEDMANEWHQHNIACSLLPDGSRWKESARDVDLDWKDEGKGLFDHLMDRLEDREQ